MRCSPRCLPPRCSRTCTCDDAPIHQRAGRDRLDRRFGARRHRAPPRPFRGDGADRAPAMGEARGAVRAASPGGRRAVRSRRQRTRSSARSRARGCPRVCSPARKAVIEAAALPGVHTVRGRHRRRGGPAADARRCACRQADPAREQGGAGDRRRRVHGGRRRRAAPRCSRSTASTTRSSSAFPSDYARNPVASGVRRILLTASGGPFRTAPARGTRLASPLTKPVRIRTG